MRIPPAACARCPPCRRQIGGECPRAGSSGIPHPVGELSRGTGSGCERADARLDPVESGTVDYERAAGYRKSNWKAIDREHRREQDHNTADRESRPVAMTGTDRLRTLAGRTCTSSHPLPADHDRIRLRRRDGPLASPATTVPRRRAAAEPVPQPGGDSHGGSSAGKTCRHGGRFPPVPDGAAGVGGGENPPDSGGQTRVSEAPPAGDGDASPYEPRTAARRSRSGIKKLLGEAKRETGKTRKRCTIKSRKRVDHRKEADFDPHQQPVYPTRQCCRISQQQPCGT